MTGLVLTVTVETLEVGTSDATIKGTYTITQADISGGK
jgi:hypothetical protein